MEKLISESDLLGSQYLSGECPNCFKKMIETETSSNIFKCPDCESAARYCKIGAVYYFDRYETDIAGCSKIIPRKNQ